MQEESRSFLKTVLSGVILAILFIGLAKGVSYYRSSKVITTSSSTSSTDVGAIMHAASGDAGGPPSGGTPPTGTPPTGGPQ